MNLTFSFKLGIVFITTPLALSLSAQTPLPIPDLLEGSAIELTLQNGSHEFFEGIITQTMGVNGNVLGPTLHLVKGEDVVINVTNELGQNSTVHWHGMHVAAENDGGPHTVIDAGSTWSPEFTIMDRSGTYWYHPHLHMNTNEQVSKGMAGVIIVSDNEEAQLDLPRTYGIDDFPLVIQTKDFDDDFQIVSESNADDIVMVNATIDGMLEVPAQVIRLRLLNGSSQRTFVFGFDSGQTFHQIASDGGLLPAVNSTDRIKLAPGERAEILVDLGGMQGSTLQLMSFASELSSGIYGATNPGMMGGMTLTGYSPNPLNGTDFEILQLQIIESTENPVESIITALPAIEVLDEADADLVRNLVLSPESAGMNQLNGNFLINGALFDMEVINYTIPLDNTEIWEISNQSASAHPFHIHDVQFQILDRGGVAPGPEEQGWKDVVLIHPMETVRFITQFNDFSNDDVPYMYHCHMLHHEDGGMMGQFVVVDGNSIAESADADQLSIYPQPADDWVTILAKDLNIGEQLLLYNATGQLIKSQRINQPKFRMYVGDLSPGLYVVRSANGVATSIVVH